MKQGTPTKTQDQVRRAQEKEKNGRSATYSRHEVAKKMEKRHQEELPQPIQLLETKV